MEKLAPTKPQEYRKGKVKLYKCVSGFTVKLRKMSAPVMGEMLSIIGLEVPQGIPLEQAEEMLQKQMKDPKFTEKVIKAAEYVVPRTVVEPKIIDGDAFEENTLSVQELDPGDLFEIFNESVDFSGLAGAAEKMREKFRGQLARKDSSKSST